MSIRYLIVDDEPLAHKVILNYCQDLDFMEFVGSCHNAVQALNKLDNDKVDLIFLDINMPKLKGLDFLRTLTHPPKVIVTTAYQEYALEGYELDIVDYLLKPFALERFLKAVNKVKRQLEEQAPPQSISTNQSSADHIMIKSDKKQFRILLDEIQYIESTGSYCKVHTGEQTLITHEKISKLEEELKNARFIRVHKSYLAPLSKIHYLEGNRIFLKNSNDAIPIGKTYKMNLKDWEKN